MALFKKREKRTIAELEDYYASRHNSGKAWAMAFLSLLITVAILSAIFFSGRWLYRTLTDDDSVSTTDTSSQVEGSVVPGLNIDGETQDQTNPEVTVVDPEASEEATSQEDSDFPGVVSDEAASTSTPNEIAQTAGDSTELAATGDLPDTGAGEILLIAPLIAAIAGYIFSIRYQIEKL